MNQKTQFFLAWLQACRADDWVRAGFWNGLLELHRRGEISEGQYRQIAHALDSTGERPGPTIRALATLPPQERYWRLGQIAANAKEDGLTPIQALDALDRTRETAHGFGLGDEAAYRDIVEGFGGQRMPGRTYAETVRHYVHGFLSGNVAGRAPFQHQSREERLRALAAEWGVSPQMLGSLVGDVERTTVQEKLNYRFARRDVELPRVEEKPSPERISDEKRRADVERAAGRATATRKKFDADTPIRAAALRAMRHHDVDPEFTSNATISVDDVPALGHEPVSVDDDAQPIRTAIERALAEETA